MLVRPLCELQRCSIHARAAGCLAASEVSRASTSTLVATNVLTARRSAFVEFVAVRQRRTGRLEWRPTALE